MTQRKIGIILSYVYNGVHVAVSFIYVPLLLKIIGQGEYGLYQIVGSIISYFSIMESSLSGAVLRFYCKAKAENDKEQIAKTIATSRRIYHVISLLVVFGSIIGIVGIRLFYVDSFSKTELIESQIMLAILALNMIVSLQNYVYVAIINGNERFIFLKILGISSQLIQPLAVVLFIKRYPYAVIIVLIQFFINLIQAVIKKQFAKTILRPQMIPNERIGFDDKIRNGIFALSSQIILAVLADQIFWKTDQILIGKILGTSLTAVYSVGAQIYLNYNPVGTAVSGVFMPHISRLFQREDHNRLISDLFVRVGRIATYLLLLVLTAFVVFGKEFISIWVGTDYDMAYYVALCVMIPATVDVSQNLGITILQVYNKYSFRSKIYFILAIINVFLTIILLHHFGIVGAAAATGISSFLGNGIIMNLYYNSLGLDMKLFWKKMLPIYTVASACLMIGFLIRLVSLSNPWIEFIVHGLLFLLMYCSAMFFMVLDSYEKDLVYSLCHRLSVSIRKGHF